MKKILSEEQLSLAFEETIDNGSWPACYTPFIRIFREIESLQGRPDFVGLNTEANQILLKDEKELAAALRTPSLTKVLSLLHYNAARTEKYLFQASGLSQPVFRRSIAILKSSELIQSTAQSGYMLSESFPRIKWELWAFEVKLDYWQRALYQALQYRAFAHRVAVVLPEVWVHRAGRNSERFKALNVGLIALNEDKSTIRFLVRPRKRRPASRHHYLYALGKLLSESTLCSY